MKREDILQGPNKHFDQTKTLSILGTMCNSVKNYSILMLVFIKTY